MHGVGLRPLNEPLRAGEMQPKYRTLLKHTGSVAENDKHG